MKKTILKIMLIAAVTTIIFTGCSKNASTSIKTNTTTEKNVTPMVARANPEDTVSEYYNSEVSKDSNFLSGFFLNSKMSQSTTLKEQLVTFNVKKLQLINIYNKKAHGNYITMVCAYNTYFNGIATPRPDVEIVTLVQKSGKWYFLNDYSKVADNDMKWINEMAITQKNEISKNKIIQKIEKQNAAFDVANSEYLANASKTQTVKQ